MENVRSDATKRVASLVSILPSDPKAGIMSFIPIGVVLSN
jgi:hypothetical protein